MPHLDWDPVQLTLLAFVQGIILTQVLGCGLQGRTGCQERMAQFREQGQH